MPKFCQMVSLNNTFVNSSRNQGYKSYPQTLEKDDCVPLKFKRMTFTLFNIALRVITRKWKQRKEKTSKGNF